MKGSKAGSYIGKIILSLALVAAAYTVAVYSLPIMDASSEGNGRFQQQLSRKLTQVAKVWAAVKVTSGVISFVQTIQVEGSIPVVGGLAVSAQPLGWADVIDNTLDQISNILLWAMGAIAIQKLLLAVSVWVSFRVIVPMCAGLIIIALWNKRLGGQLKRVIAGIVIIFGGVCLAVPLSLELSNAIETSILAPQMNRTIGELENQSKEIESEGNEINDASLLDKLKKIGSDIFNFFGTLKQKFDTFIENTINYLMCFIVINIIIPIGTIVGLKYLGGVALRVIGFSGFRMEGKASSVNLPR